jgi:outer membrane murein-binding lipoprotein Lpp
VKGIIAVAIAVLALALAGGASARTVPGGTQALRSALAPPVRKGPTSQSAQAKTLAARVAALEKKVKTLNKDVVVLANIAGASLAYTECSIGATADAFAGTWNVIDQIAQATQGRTYFGAQPVVSDYQACAAFKINRSVAVPPNLSVFSALTSLLK